MEFEKPIHTKKQRASNSSEYFEENSESQLQTSLELEFEQFKKDTLPIPGVFDSGAELQALKTLPREQKREALADFKSKLVRQSKARAICRTFLRKKIEVNHDVEKQDLMDWIDKFSNEYGFTDFQKQMAEGIIDEYYANHQRVKDFRQKYQDDKKLVSKLTGIQIKNAEKLDVSVGLMGLDIYCDALTAGRLSGEAEEPIAFKGSAFTSYSEHDPPIKYNVFNIGKECESSKPHEDQHQENALFAPLFDLSPDKSHFLRKQYENERDTDTKRKFLEIYLKAVRASALVRAKNELVAMKRDGDSYIYDIWFKQDDSEYDYLANIRNSKKKKKDPLWQEMVRKILVEEYKTIIERAISAFDQLQEKGGYTTDQTIALLTEKPLTQWPKTAKRLLEENK